MFRTSCFVVVWISRASLLLFSLMKIVPGPRSVVLSFQFGGLGFGVNICAGVDRVGYGSVVEALILFFRE